jgi:uncharacterized protein YceK
MKRIKLLVIVAITIMATGCISIIEELTLNKDGSGTFAYTIDLTALMELGVMDQARTMSEELDEEAIEVDTVMSAYETLEAKGSLADMDKPEFWKKVRMVSKISESEKVGMISFILDFDEISEVDYFMKNLSKLLETDETAGMLGGMGLMGSADGGSPYNFKKKLFGKSLIRGKQEGASELSAAMEEEGGEMMKMMLQGGEYITIVNLPGKAKKVSNKAATTSNDGQTVKVAVDLLEYLEGKADLANEIKFK